MDSDPLPDYGDDHEDQTPDVADLPDDYDEDVVQQSQQAAQHKDKPPDSDTNEDYGSAAAITLKKQEHGFKADQPEDSKPDYHQNKDENEKFDDKALHGSTSPDTANTFGIQAFDESEDEREIQETILASVNSDDESFHPVPLSRQPSHLSITSLDFRTVRLKGFKKRKRQTLPVIKKQKTEDTNVKSMSELQEEFAKLYR